MFYMCTAARGEPHKSQFHVKMTKYILSACSLGENVFVVYWSERKSRVQVQWLYYSSDPGKMRKVGFYNSCYCAMEVASHYI